MSFTGRPLTPPPPSGRGPALPVAPSGRTPTGWRLTALTRTGIWRAAGSLTWEIWSWPSEVRKVLDQIEETAGEIFRDGKLPFLIGGEHLVTLGSVRAAARKYPDLHILHFDAHTDLREDYLGVELSHACVLRRCWELLGDGRIHQFGIRSGERAEFGWAREGHTDLHPFTLEGLGETLEKLRGVPVYFTVDLDVMDPSVFPGTGTPEPGGVSYMELQRAVTEVCRKAEVIGCDVTELSPPFDPTGASTAVACKIIREMLIALGTK